MSHWLLNHPSRLSWCVIELMRPLPWTRRLANLWWQMRFYGRIDKFRESIEEHRREWDALMAQVGRETETE